MENHTENNQGEKKASGFKAFAAKRIIVAAVLIIVVVWAFGIGLDFFNRSGGASSDHREQQTQATAQAPERQVPESDAEPSDTHSSGSESSEQAQQVAEPSGQSERTADTAGQTEEGGSHAGPAEDTSHTQAVEPDSTPSHDQDAATKTPMEAAGGPEEKPAEPQEQHVERPRGVAFVEAVIKPINHELGERFWGWRPNDIINFTDNTNNFQLGVLEVTRRSVVMLTERISRTGSTDRLNPHLEDAANWLMVTASRYWFPSPESKYRECIKELEAYKQELIKGNASFYIRADNLIPLLSSYEDLLGSCDENLVKLKNEDGSDVGFFMADDYFFYAKGVGSAMATILESIHHDFLPTLENRHGTELLHHALLSCRRAAALSPLLITNADLDGIFANHRANMAAPISHARYYIGQLIKTLST